LALAALDVESDVDQVDLQCGMEELRRRLEVLLGARPEAPRDESVRRDRESEAARSAELERAAAADSTTAAASQTPPDHEPSAERQVRREKLAATGGQLLNAAFQFLGELLPAQPDSSPTNEAANVLAATLKQNLTELVDQDDQGRPRLTFSLPDASSLDNLANTLARLLAHGQRST
jgi:hypothetical protein